MDNIKLIEQAFELLGQVELTDENRRIIAQKYIDLMNSDDDDEQPAVVVDPESN